MIMRARKCNCLNLFIFPIFYVKTVDVEQENEKFRHKMHDGIFAVKLD